MPNSRGSGVIALLLLLSFAGAAPARAAEPAPADKPLRIVPAVRYGGLLADREGGSLAPRVRPILAWYQDEARPGEIAVVYTPEPRESFPTMLLDGENRILSRGTSFRWGDGWLWAMIPWMHIAYGLAEWTEGFRPGRDFSEGNQ